MYLLTIFLMYPYFNSETYSLRQALINGDWLYVFTVPFIQFYVMIYLLIFEMKNLFRFNNWLTI
jgi:hypothetical protein